MQLPQYESGGSYLGGGGLRTRLLGRTKEAAACFDDSSSLDESSSLGEASFCLAGPAEAAVPSAPADLCSIPATERLRQDCPHNVRKTTMKLISEALRSICKRTRSDVDACG